MEFRHHNLYMKRLYLKIGDVFVVKLDDKKRYFQYVSDDLTQLNSEVVRVFKKSYGLDDSLDLTDVVSEEVDFYTHTVIKLGAKLNLWEKAGNTPEIGTTEILFRDCGDYGISTVKKSEDWYSWKIIEPMIRVGKLEGKNQKAHIGVIVNPAGLVSRMKTGLYHAVYPEF